MSIGKIDGITDLTKLWGHSDLSKWDGTPFDFAAAADYDFKVLRGTVIIASGNTSVTITEGTDYTLESGQTSGSCFIQITNLRLTGMGRTSSGTGQQIRDFTAYVSNPSNIATSITFTRFGTTGDNRIDYEIIQYIGDADGPNEIKVAYMGVADIASGTATVDVASLSHSVVDYRFWKVVPFITGQAAAVASANNWYEALSTSDREHYHSSYWKATFKIGANATAAVKVSYALVYFRGVNWKINFIDNVAGSTSFWTPSTDAYVDSDLLDPYNYGSAFLENGVVLNDYTKTFLHVQFRTNQSPTGLDDAGRCVYLLSNTVIRVRNRAVAWGYLHMWVIENLGTESGKTAVVEHHYLADNTLSGDEERQWTESITTIDALENTMLAGMSASIDGTGTAVPRGAINVRLTGKSELTLTENDMGQERRISTDIVQLPYCISSAPSVPSSYLDLKNLTTDTVYGTNFESSTPFRKMDMSDTDEQWFRVVPTFTTYGNFLIDFVWLGTVGAFDWLFYDENMSLIAKGDQTDFTSLHGIKSNGFGPCQFSSQYFYLKIVYSGTSYPFNLVSHYQSGHIEYLGGISSGGNITDHIYNGSFYYSTYVIFKKVSGGKISVYHNYSGNTYLGRDYALYALSYDESVPTAALDDGNATGSDNNKKVISYPNSGDADNGYYILCLGCNAGITGEVDVKISIGT